MQRAIVHVSVPFTIRETRPLLKAAFFVARLNVLGTDTLRGWRLSG